MKDLFQKIHGCLAGLAVGDALGMPSEFMTPEQIRESFGHIEALEKAPAFHPHHFLQAGQITDDTGQALAIAHACSPDGEIHAEDAARYLLAWEDSLPEDLLRGIEGPSTRAALKEIRQGGDPRHSGRNGRTNGAAMRMAAVGLLHGGDLAGACSAAIEASLPTHATGIALAGGACVACAIAAALDEDATVASILRAAKEGADTAASQGVWAWSTSLSSRIDLALQLVERAASEAEALSAIYQYVGVDMLVPESVAAAMGIVFLAQGDPMKAVRFGANIGGDTDTIAAIAGQICGAFRGIDAIDPAMVNQVEIVNHLDLKEESRRILAMLEKKEP